MGAADETGDGLLFCVFESMVPSVSKPIADNGSLFLKLKFFFGDVDLTGGSRTKIPFLIFPMLSTLPVDMHKKNFKKMKTMPPLIQESYCWREEHRLIIKMDNNQQDISLLKNFFTVQGCLG